MLDLIGAVSWPDHWARGGTDSIPLRDQAVTFHTASAISTLHAGLGT